MKSKINPCGLSKQFFITFLVTNISYIYFSNTNTIRNIKSHNLHLNSLAVKTKFDIFSFTITKEILIS